MTYAKQLISIANGISLKKSEFNFELLCGLCDAFDLGVATKTKYKEMNMGWSVVIVPPEGFPDVKESIVSFSRCPSNMYCAVMEMNNEKQLKNMEKDEAIAAIKRVIAEVDKDNDGMFSDQYAFEADQKWSNGRETTKEWEQYKHHLGYMPFKTYHEFCGWEVRNRIREVAIRFLLYYVAGYRIEFVW